MSCTLEVDILRGPSPSPRREIPPSSFDSISADQLINSENILRIN